MVSFAPTAQSFFAFSVSSVIFVVHLLFASLVIAASGIHSLVEETGGGRASAPASDPGEHKQEAGKALSRGTPPKTPEA